MAAENIGSEILRDPALEQRMLEAVIADRNDQPRSQQLQVGPSQVGGCRELLRAGLFEGETVAEPETHWAAAAHIGQVMGADLERIFEQRIDAITQQRVTAMFGMFGLQISGATDLMWVEGDSIGDLKSVDDMGGKLYDLKRNASAIDTLLAIYREGLLFAKNIEGPNGGGYELTQEILNKISKLSNYIQIAIYVVGAMQTGILTPDATGRLVYYDRSGNYQGFVAVVIPTEQIQMFYAIAQLRIGQVLQTQQAYVATGGNPAVLKVLRDMAPSYCFSPKVMCPRREHCWTGSEWTTAGEITNQEHIDAAMKYDVGRELAKLGEGMKRSGKDVLKPEEITGRLPDGSMLTWTGAGAINLVKTTVPVPQAQAVLDKFMPPADIAGEVAAEQARPATPTPQVDTSEAPVDTEPPVSTTEQPETPTEGQVPAAPTLTREQRFKALSKTGAPVVRRMAAGMTGIELKGLKKEDAIDAILNHEYPPTPSEADAPVEAAASEGDLPAARVVTADGQVVAEGTEGGGVLTLPPELEPTFDPELTEEEWNAQQVEAAHRAGLAEDAANWVADPRRISPVSEQDAAHAAEHAANQEAVNPGLGRVVFQNSDGSPQGRPEPEVSAQEEARRRLMHGPGVAPLLDKPAPEAKPTSVATLPDGSPYEPMEKEDPARPGLFLHGTGGDTDRLRQMQYDADQAWRSQLLRQRSLYEGRIPKAQQ